MDLKDIPFDVPIILHSIRKHKNLQNPVSSKMAHCLANNCDVYEYLVLRHIDDDKVAIQSARDDRFLQVRSNGDCVFDSTRLDDCDLFTMEINAASSIYFVSYFTGNVLQCDDDDAVRCVNKDRLECEAWTIMEPRTADATAPAAGHWCGGQDRQRLILDLAKGGKSPDEIEKIVTRLVGVRSTLAIPLDQQ